MKLVTHGLVKGGGGGFLSAGHHQEAGGVVLILDVAGDDLQAVELGGQGGRDRAAGRIGFSEQQLGGQRCRPPARSSAPCGAATLRHWPSADGHGGGRSSRPPASRPIDHQLEVDRLELLTDDPQGPKTAAGGARRPPGPRWSSPPGSCRAGSRPPSSASNASSKAACGTGSILRERPRRRPHGCWRRVRPGRRSVPWSAYLLVRARALRGRRGYPRRSGASSMTAAQMDMPSSSARSCSSRSRFSSGEGGAAVKASSASRR